MKTSQPTDRRWYVSYDPNTDAPVDLVEDPYLDVFNPEGGTMPTAPFTSLQIWYMEDYYDGQPHVVGLMGCGCCADLWDRTPLEMYENGYLIHAPSPAELQLLLLNHYREYKPTDRAQPKMLVLCK